MNSPREDIPVLCLESHIQQQVKDLQVYLLNAPPSSACIGISLVSTSFNEDPSQKQNHRVVKSWFFQFRSPKCFIRMAVKPR